MKQLLIIGLLPLLVAGCLKTPQERWQEARNSSATECRKIGYKVGSVEYKQCIERGINNRREARERQLKEFYAASERRKQQNKTCHTTYHGNTATTRCN